MSGSPKKVVSMDASITDALPSTLSPAAITLCKEINLSSATLRGIEAIAVNCLETGEHTEDDLMHIADLASACRQQLQEIRLRLSE